MNKTMKFAGWPSITDVACPCKGCNGILRWAEAGHVPGYRICDGSKHRHHFALDGDRLIEQRERREKGTPVDRAAERDRLIAIDIANGRDHAERSIKSDGIDISAFWAGFTGSPGYGTGAAEKSYWSRLREIAADAVAEIDRIRDRLPRSLSLCNLHADGECMLYRQQVSGQLGGGTLLAKAEKILSTETSREILADQYAIMIGARRGYRVPK
jgi:hypothetical protein